MVAIIFDIDGTLTDTTKVDDKCFIEAFNNIFGINISNQNWSELTNVTDWGITEEIILNNKNRIPTDVEYEKMISEFFSLLQSEFNADKKQFCEIKGAYNFIKFLLKKSNIKIGIATGGWAKSANLKLKSIGIDSSEFVFFNSNHFKTREDILLNTIRKLNQNTENNIDRIIYFGDGTWDFLTCEKLGIEFIGIDNLENNKLKNLGVKNIYKDFENYEIIYKNLVIKESTNNNIVKKS
ncbi:HAD hydrolase-like protein [Polaribacter batillariae]|uniref:phosphoglycolate phosphatase n=1 Tax=Polaribacter batillariae TaxID=2808900 RepID=A0ABX7SX23_9FLAO|nr:HAD hydrolase-like protein [Polaribacter batillariae]QTD38046.1 HAD hydrolase-like protein [Polaribacter batillariae]